MLLIESLKAVFFRFIMLGHHRDHVLCLFINNECEYDARFRISWVGLFNDDTWVYNFRNKVSRTLNFKQVGSTFVPKSFLVAHSRCL